MKIVVLLSSYNGERYIKEQIDSIIAQSCWRDCRLCVRDDGSHDGTRAILEEYAAKGLLELEEGENVGFVQSFFSLLRNAPSADFYAFSDQDDVWLPQKLELAAQKLQAAQGESAQKPLLYYSNFEVCDQDLRFAAENSFRPEAPAFCELCLNSALSGFTFVFNRALREKLCRLDARNIDGHDYVAAMCASALGEIVADQTVTAKYRRHSANTSPATRFSLKNLAWKIRRFVFVKDNRIGKQLEEFYNAFKAELKSEDAHLLRLLLHDKTIRFCRLKLLFYKKRFRESTLQDLALRVFLFLGLL